jgi:hypothetical protein
MLVKKNKQKVYRKNYVNDFIWLSKKFSNIILSNTDFGAWIRTRSVENFIPGRIRVLPGPGPTRSGLGPGPTRSGPGPGSGSGPGSGPTRSGPGPIRSGPTRRALD